MTTRKAIEDSKRPVRVQMDTGTYMGRIGVIFSFLGNLDIVLIQLDAGPGVRGPLVYEHLSNITIV